jgi:hypothetical protein
LFLPNVSLVPKVANNCSTINGCFGAIAALAMNISYTRFVPKEDLQKFRISVVDWQETGIGSAQNNNQGKVVSFFQRVLNEGCTEKYSTK